MASIRLSDGSEALVDDADAEFLSRWRWKRHTQGYAARSSWVDGRYVTVLMHRAVAGAGPSHHVHHLNHNKLDNRRENLALVDPAEHLRGHVGHLVTSAKARQIYPDVKVCANCGADFTPNPRKRKRQKCCSPTCAQAMRVAATIKAGGYKWQR